MTYNKKKLPKAPKAPRKLKNKFGLYCQGLRKLLGFNISQAAQIIGVSQPYLTQLENGTEPLTSVAFYKCLRGYLSFENLSVATKLALIYEMLQIVETIEINLSQVTIIHRENLLRFIAELLLNEEYPPGELQSVPWNKVSGYVRSLKDPPPALADCLRIVSKRIIEPEMIAQETGK